MTTQFLLIICTISLMSIIPSNVKAAGNVSGIGFYNTNSLPSGIKSVDPIIENWWNWWARQPSTYSQNWPSCMMGQAEKIAGNQSVVFFGDPAAAVDTNVNARNQKCQISSDQAIFFPPYNGLCNTGEEGHEKDTPAGLLACAIGTNEGIKLKTLKIDGKDFSNQIFRTRTTSSFIWDVPRDNIYGFPPSNGNVGRHTSMAEGYYVFIKPLPVGTHIIEVEVIRAPPPDPVEHPIVKYTVNVVSLE